MAASEESAGKGENQRSDAQMPVMKRLATRGTIEVTFLGMRRRWLSDVYYGLLKSSWRWLLATIALIYVSINACFALVYLVFGGIEGARRGSFADAFFFSVQTMATIGYGAMHPRTPFANILVTLEALIGLLGVAMATGVLFAKFARPVGRLIFSNVAVISMREGVPSFMFRVANERANHVMEATLKASIVRDEVTSEGEKVRRWYELPLVRNSSPIFALTWTAIHAIDSTSKLFGETPESMRRSRTEIVITLWGTDATLASTIYARHSYVPAEVFFDCKLADILSFDGEGKRVIDFHKFHDIVPVTTPVDAS